MVICDIYRFSFFLSSHISIYNIVVSNFNRIIALTSLFKYRKIVIKRLLFNVPGTIDVSSLLFDIIPFFFSTDSNGKQCHYVPFQIWSITYNGDTVLVPLFILIVNYILTTHVVQRHHKQIGIIETLLGQAESHYLLGAHDNLLSSFMALQTLFQKFIYVLRSVDKILHQSTGPC